MANGRWNRCAVGRSPRRIQCIYRDAVAEFLNRFADGKLTGPSDDLLLCCDQASFRRCLPFVFYSPF
jgi:hypothetical protein